jgi:hypothetical protein
MIYLKYLKLSLIFCFLCGIGIFLFLVLFFNTYFDSRTRDIGRYIPLESVLDNYLTSLDLIFIHILNSSSENNFSQTTFKEISKNEGFLSNEIVSFSNDFVEESEKWILKGIKSLNQLMDDFVLLASQGFNVRNQYSEFVQPITNVIFCFQNIPYAHRTEVTTFFNAGIFILYQIRFLIHRESISEWEILTELCEAISGYSPITNGIMKIFDEFDNSASQQFEESKKTILLIFILCSVSYICIFLTCLILFSILSFQELNALSTMVLKMNPAHRSKASEYISYVNSELQKEELNDSLPKKGVKLIGSIILNVLFILIALTFILIFYFITNSQNSRIRNFGGWMLLDYRRLGQSLRILFDITLLIGITNEQINISYVNIESLQQDILILSEKIQQENSFLLGNGHLLSIIGENQEFDKYNIENICDTSGHVNEVVNFIHVQV